MLSLLFDKNFFIGVFSVIIIVLIIWLCVKFPSARMACFIILSVVFTGLTAYCVVNLNIYYNAKGGIYGQISGLFSPSVSVGETTIEFNNLELIQYLDTNTYYCEIISDKAIEIDEDKNYQMYINNTPCSSSKISSNYISSEFRYQFLNEKDEVLCDDTLQIRLVFNKNNSHFYIYTENGTETIKYWNYYINKNDFVISLQETNTSNFDKINFATGEFDDFYKVQYIYTDNFTETRYFKANSKLELVNLVGIANWSIDEQTVNENYVITKDITVEANFYEFDRYMTNGLVCELENGYLIGASGPTNVGVVYYSKQTQEYSVVSFYGYGYNGYSQLSDHIALITSEYSTIDSLIFNETTMEIMHFNFAFDKGLIFANNSMLKVVYANENVEGVYVYDVYNKTTEKIYETGYWTNFYSKFNESTGEYSSVNIRNSNYDYYLRYDFIEEKLDEIDNDMVVGF